MLWSATIALTQACEAHILQVVGSIFLGQALTAFFLLGTIELKHLVDYLARVQSKLSQAQRWNDHQAMTPSQG